LGISGSPRSGKTTDKLVMEVLKAVDAETEFVSLAGKKIGPCIACLGCVEDNVCKVKDDMTPLRDKLLEADGFVFGAANFFMMLNGLTHCFLERFYQFRHRDGMLLAGKPAVIVGVGGGMPEEPVKNLDALLQYNHIDTIDSVTAQGAACCFTCGYGETCAVGAIHMFFGPGTKITDDIIPALEKQPEAMENARIAGQRLSDHLKKFAAGT